MTPDAISIPGDIVDEAIGWMVASREGLTGDERADFQAWFAADVRHGLAWQRLENSLAPFRVVEAQRVSGETLVASLTQRKVSRRAVIGNGSAAVAVLALTVGVSDRVTPVGGLFADYSTATGQRRRFTLPDGSALVLDARSEADRTLGDGRPGVALRSGLAFVDIRPGDDPLVVAAGDARISSTGGSLIVSRRDERLRVICMRAGAELTLSGGARERLAAGTGYFVEDSRLRPLPERQTRDAASWMDGKVILHDRSLGDLFDAFRPYRAGILSISAAAARLPISGVFDLDRLDDAIALVTELFPVRVLRVGSLFARIDLL